MLFLLDKARDVIGLDGMKGFPRCYHTASISLFLCAMQDFECNIKARMLKCLRQSLFEQPYINILCE